MDHGNQLFPIGNKNGGIPFRSKVPSNVPVWTKFLNPKLDLIMATMTCKIFHPTQLKKTSHPATTNMNTCLRYLFSPLEKKEQTNKQHPWVFPQQKNITTPKNPRGKLFSGGKKNSLSVKLVVVTVACRRVVSWSANLGGWHCEGCPYWTDIFGAH